MTDPPADPHVALAAIASELGATLGPELLALYVHGSLVSGDFDPARSDLDLLAVLADEPDDAMLVSLGTAHSRIDAAHPPWVGRIEVEYVGADTLAQAAADVGPLGKHDIARISPGEPLHLLPASSHRLLTWSSVRANGRPLLGPAPADLLPAVDSCEVRRAVLDHVRDWPGWVREMHRPGGQAYAVLTVCRALRLLTTGEQVSKRRAAAWAVSAVPERAELITWARNWWYAAGSDDEPSRLPEVAAFVDETCAQILADEAPGPGRAVCANTGSHHNFAPAKSGQCSDTPPTRAGLRLPSFRTSR